MSDQTKAAAHRVGTARANLFDTINDDTRSPGDLTAAVNEFDHAVRAYERARLVVGLRALNTHEGRHCADLIEHREV